MAKRQSQIEKAIQSLQDEIDVLQLAQQKLKAQLKTGPAIPTLQEDRDLWRQIAVRSVQLSEKSRHGS